MLKFKTAGICALFTGLSLLCSNVIADSPVQPARLEIRSNPAGAIVVIDGKREGVSPVVVYPIKPGGHIVTLEKKGYDTISTSVKIEQSQDLVREIKMKPTLGLLIIDSEPSDVDVKIDGADRGRTPLLITDLPLGKYKTEFKKPGFQNKNIEFIIKSRAPMKVFADLTSDSGSLNVTSEPSGAQVIINGILRGTTPCNVDRMPAGTANLELQLEGYKPYKREIRMIAGREETITAALMHVPANLTVVSLPKEARIYVNNQYRGKAPVTLKTLKPGEYRVRAEIEGFDPVARTIELGNGEEKTEEFRLDANCGRLEIVTQPAGVSVYIDGKPQGVTTVKIGQTDNVSNPLVIPLIRSGTHVIKLASKKYYTSTVEVTIEENETTLVQKALKRKFIPDIELKTVSGVERGVLLETYADGSVKIEIRPGVIKKIKARDILARNPIRSNTR